MTAVVCPPVVLPKRTNSLGYASSDCHRCRAAERRCDRRRPRCLACTDDGIVCPGFAQKLDWQRGIASRGKMSDRTFAVPAVAVGGQEQPPTTFSFVQESGRRTSTRIQRTRRRRAATKTHPFEPAADAAAATDCTQSPTISADIPLSPPSLPRSMLNPFRLTQPCGDMLNYYQLQFSSVMLTFHVHVNPWQLCLPMSFDIPCLMDAIVAVSKRHRAQICQQAEDVDVLVLKDRALRTFRAALHTTDPAALLATILTFVGLDYARTSYANWAVHIEGAHRIIEASGGIGMARHNASLRSLIVMLIWYDLMAALLSRRCPIFPKEYLLSVMDWRSAYEWSLVGLNGFPDEMFDLIYDIASASASTAASSSPAHVSAGTSAVLRDTAAELERRLWVAQIHTHSPSSSATLFDCWRQAMLLYCARVFSTGATNPFSRGPVCAPVLGPLCLAGTESNSAAAIDGDGDGDCSDPIVAVAVDILGIVRRMDPTSSMQKQCLLPVVLAASELGSTSPAHRRLRAEVEDYLERWSRLAGLRMYLSARRLMRTVWAYRDRYPNSHRHYWWGDVVRQQATQPSGGGDELEATKEWMFG